MDKLFRKIYDEVICYEKDVAGMNRTIENNNKLILEKYNGSLNEKEKEIFLELIDDAASFAGREGFCMGMKYAFKSMVMLFKD